MTDAIERIPARRWISSAELDEEIDRDGGYQEKTYSSMARVRSTGERSSDMVCSRISSAV